MNEKITKLLMTALAAAAVLAAIIADVRAQQQFTPAQQAAMNLGQQIGLLSQNNAELAAQIQQLNAQIAEKDRRIKTLEDAAKKPEEKK